jgi:dihydrolipoamide dehydrogenase
VITLEKYNTIVIGGGSAGLVSAYINATLKSKVALVEKDKMGGDCLNTGCVPSKALIRTARFIADMKKHEQLGIKSVQYEFDFKEIMARVQRVVNQIAPHDSVDRYTSLGVECLSGEALISDKHTVQVNGEIYKTKNIILAQGAEPFIPPIKGLDRIEYLTSDNLWKLQELPKRLLIVGGGPVGTELAQAFARLGSKVTQVEMNSRILSREDEDVSLLIQEKLKQDGVEFIFNAKAREVALDLEGEKCLLYADKTNNIKIISFDHILIAVGRKARVSGLKLDELGLSLNKNKTLKVDKYMRANGSNIYAAGDITGPYQFTHMAAHQAYYASVNALFKPFKFQVDYSTVPWVTYTDPEIAQVGYNETRAKEAGICYSVTKYDIGELDRAITESESHGFVKVLTEPCKDKIIGATIVAHNAGEMNTEFVTAMKYDLGLEKILGTIHPYPTMSEANKYVSGMWKKANTRPWLLELVEKFHRWVRR